MNSVAWATVILAAATGGVAFVTYNNARQSLRERLFDRRYEVFLECQEYLDKAMHNPYNYVEQGVTLRNLGQKSRFLFDTDMERKLVCIEKHVLDFQSLAKKGQQRSEEENAEFIDLGQRITKQCSNLSTMFDSYLRLSL